MFEQAFFFAYVAIVTVAIAAMISVGVLRRWLEASLYERPRVQRGFEVKQNTGGPPVPLDRK
jgi:hypothetical protein